jgi:predicted metalloendopeptidase
VLSQTAMAVGVSQLFVKRSFESENKSLKNHEQAKIDIKKAMQTWPNAKSQALGQRLTQTSYINEGLVD